MKIRYIFALAAASALLVSSCSVFENFSNKIGNTPKKRVTAVEPSKVEKAPEVTTPSKPKEANPVKEQTAQKDKKHSVPTVATKPSPKKKEEKTKVDPNPKKTETKKGNQNYKVKQTDYDKINGEWSIMSVFGEKIVADEHPQIYFESSSHRFYGNNGCNTINGQFTVTGENKLLLTDIATTMMLCPDAQFEYKINQALGQVAGYEISVKGQDSYLNLKSVKGITVMTLHRSDNSYIDGAWQVMSVNGNRMAVNSDMRLVLDVTEGRVHGNVGCNMVNGTLLVDSEQTSSIQFVSLLATRMTCPDQALETALVLALENVNSWVRDGSNHLILKDSSGKEVIKLRKLTREELGR